MLQPSRVLKSSQDIDGQLISSIGRGLCVLLGIARGDCDIEVEYMVRKILNLRLFEDENGKAWAKSVADRGLEVLCVSQFTLNSVLKGNKPDFHAAMSADQSQALYSKFLSEMSRAYCVDRVKDGKFQAYMQVHIQNDGPVTITLDSPVPSAKDLAKETKKVARTKTSSSTAAALESDTSSTSTAAE